MILLYLPAAYVCLVLAAMLADRVTNRRAPLRIPPLLHAGGGAFLLHFLFLYPLALLPARWIYTSDLAKDRKLWGIAVAGLIGIRAATQFPHWLAWRVLGPSRAAPFGHALLASGLVIWTGDHARAAELYAVRFLGAEPPHAASVDLWTVAMAALRAEAAGEPERADALLDLLPLSVDGLPRTVAAEGLAEPAAWRGEWERVLGRAAKGGRGSSFLARLAAFQLGPPGPPGRQLGRPVAKLRLVLSWALAPGRIAAFPWLWSALVAPRSRPAPPPPPIPDLAGMAPPLAHLHLLARAASGLPVTTGEVEKLARAWDGELSPRAGADLARRGLALGGEHPADLPAVFRRSIVAELEILAEGTEGTWERSGERDPAAPAASAASAASAAALARHRLHRAFEDVQQEVLAFGRRAEPAAKCRPFASPMEELERWLLFRHRIERLGQVGGEPALRTAWHNGLRETVCNWPVFLHDQQGDAAIWVAYLLHRWSYELAERVRDEEITELSWRNASRVEDLLKERGLGALLPQTPEG